MAARKPRIIGQAGDHAGSPLRQRNVGRIPLRVRARISWHFGASAGRADARRRDAGDAAVHRRGAATKQMPARRRAPPGCGPQAVLLAPYIPHRLNFTHS